MFVFREKGHKNSVQYVEIVKGLRLGLTITEQYTKFGVGNPAKDSSLAYAIRRKILKVYNVDFAIHGKGKEPKDPDFMKIHVDDGTFWDILDLIQKNEKQEMEAV